MKTNKPKLFKVTILILLVLVLLLGQTSMAFASALSNQITCEDNGGTWEESTGALPDPHVRARPAKLLAVGPGYNGTCTYPVGNALSVAACGENYILTQTWQFENVNTGETCTFVAPAAASAPVETSIYGECGDLQEDAALGPVTLTPCAGSVGYATFDAGACTGNCTVGIGLPSVASNNLPDDAIATLYVMTRDEDGEPSNDSYSVCFANSEGQTLTLYRFVSGTWRALVTSSADPICANASGDGAFYLGPTN